MVSFEVGGGENVPGIPGACATHDFTYLIRGPWSNLSCYEPYVLSTVPVVFSMNRTRVVYVYKHCLMAPVLLVSSSNNLYINIYLADGNHQWKIIRQIKQAGYSGGLFISATRKMMHWSNNIPFLFNICSIAFSWDTTCNNKRPGLLHKMYTRTRKKYSMLNLWCFSWQMVIGLLVAAIVVVAFTSACYYGCVVCSGGDRHQRTMTSPSSG